MTRLSPDSDLGILEQTLPTGSTIKVERNAHLRQWEITMTADLGAIRSKIVATGETLHAAVSEAYDLALDLMHNAESRGQLALIRDMSPSREIDESDEEPPLQT